MTTIINKANPESMEKMKENIIKKEISEYINNQISFMVLSSILCSLSPLLEGKLLEIFKANLIEQIEKLKSNPSVSGLNQECIKFVDFNVLIDSLAQPYLTVTDILVEAEKNAK